MCLGLGASSNPVLHTHDGLQTPLECLFMLLTLSLFILFLQLIPFLITHFIPAVICYCWILLPVMCVLLILMCCWSRMGKSVGNEFVRYWCPTLVGMPNMDFDGFHRDKYVFDGGDFEDDFNNPLFTIPVILCLLMIPALSQSYWYSGDWNYSGALKQVLVERSVSDYFDNVASEATSFWRFLMTIL